MKKVIGLLTAFLLGAICYAQQITVMIPPFTLVEGVSRSEADTITRIFLGRLSATGTVTIINTANLQQRMTAMKWEQSDWSSKEKKTKLNEGFNAEYLIIGTISKLCGDTVIDITAENMNTFVVVGSADTTLQRSTSPNEKINDLVSGIVRTMSGGGGADITRADATPRKVVVVVPFDGKQGISPNDVETITGIFAGRLVSRGIVKVVQRDALDKVMRERQYQMSGSTSDDNLFTMGSELNGDYIVRGTITKVGSLISVTASLLDVRTLETIGVASMYLNNIEEIIGKMDGFIDEVIRSGL
jgi:TolB-like protein